METEIMRTIAYFAQFNYSPTLDELELFLQLKVEQKDLLKSLSKLIHNRRVLEKNNRYTLGEYSKGRGNMKSKQDIFQISAIRHTFAERKLEIAKRYAWWLSKIPSVRLIGVSGSLAMANTEAHADIDLFIISSAGRIWTTRLLALILSQLFGRRRTRHDRVAADKICLNLFFTETALKVPDKKKNVYIAHEILQMKPLFYQGDTYVNFLLQNRWIFDIFPNAKSYVSLKKSKTNVKRSPNLQIGDRVEDICRRVQLPSILQHKTTELVSDDQLWFFPDDYEKKIHRITT